ncbi:hypothetical protein IWQ56_001591 [Coemansia nantahalensis]|uniref:Uncharacterized protein n=1 Tax=Coemansia nantahalensis TaxID=2789366 RepID=A0ACC1K6P3_9FUNG|nr:hypothetical protein IWQ56_001591 [Coemansia nantahalensis]KAJ2774747.1 hypothetical protein IWQ57_000682 [Coemansia nantahalensis]
MGPDGSAGPPSSFTLRRERRQPTALEAALGAVGSAPWSAAALSLGNLLALGGARKRLRGYPSVMQCTWYTGIFAASAVALHTGDTTNGSGLAAAWSAIWLFFNARNAYRAPARQPKLLIGLHLLNGLPYAYKYAAGGRE